MKKNYIIATILFLILVLLISLILIYYPFDGSIDQKTQWGLLGDYLSGIFSVFNLGVVIILAFYVTNAEKQRSESELEVQRKILLSEMRFREFERLYDSTTVIFKSEDSGTTEDLRKLIVNSQMVFLLFISTKKELFSILNENDTNTLTNQIKDIYIDVVDYKHKEYLVYKSYMANKLVNPLLTFHTSLQVFIMKELRG